MKTTRTLSPSPRRRAMTLIEIMAAILVLSIGLIGVLAAIPFGGFRMAQMQEADYAAALGRNAVRLTKANGWTEPNDWFVTGNMGQVFTTDARSIFLDSNSNLKYNLTFPYFIDPTGKTSNNRTPEFYALTPNGGYNAFFTRVNPILTNMLNAADFNNRVERYFYLQDDVFYGVSNDEDETEFRPRLETENDMVLNSGAIPAFSGRYSWLASATLRSNTDPFYNASPSDVSSAEFDVAVFKDRIPGDEKAFKAVVEGSGYQGGAVTLDLTSGRDSANATLADLDCERVVEQLSTTRYLMLIGSDDVPQDGNYRAFAKWYRIANYSTVEAAANGTPTKVRLTLIGPNAPSNWANGAGTVTALFFPGVVGVYSSSTTF